MKKYITILFICFGVSLFSKEPVVKKTKQITITFHGVKEIKGKIRFSVVSEKDKTIFPHPGKEENGSFQTQVDVKTKGTVTAVIALPTDQKFAISAYHDVDNNGKFNLIMGCIPQEPYGFSILKNPPLGKPTFKQCLFNPAETNKVDVYF